MSAHRQPSRARLANDTWESLLTAHALLMREFADANIWREASMREYDVLYTLAKCPDPVRQNTLAHHVLLSQPAISRLLDRLVERGLIERIVDPHDARGRLLQLTEQGRGVQRRIGGQHSVHVTRAMTSRLDRTQLEKLGALLRALGQGDAI